MAIGPVSPRFLVNDPDNAPFGFAWLKGVTPARLGLLAAICLALASQGLANAVAKPEAAIGPILAWGFEWALRNLGFALPLFLLAIAAERLTQDKPVAMRVGALCLAVVAGAATYGLLSWSYAVHVQGMRGRVADLIPYSFSYRALVYGGFLTAVLFLATRQRQAERQLARSRVERLRNERQIAEARLRLLHAQIEPHFLFNSLASVKRLYETDPSQGRAMLRHMRDYLGIAIPAWRRRETRLDEELALCEAYLAIFRTRMGGRLQFLSEVPPELRDAAIPPLMLGTLIENALKHGIGPRASGGRITIAATQEAGALRLSVADDGIGFQDQSGHGVGLANIRSRLQTLYGGGASLDLARNPASGITATIQLPYRPLGGSAA